MRIPETTAAVAGALLVIFAGCSRDDADQQNKAPEPVASAPAVASASGHAPSPHEDDRPPPRTIEPVVILAGGDIDLSRTTGQRILRNPSLDPFDQVRPLLESADLRFANLESQLCELDGRTVSAHNHLVFSGPPTGAEVVGRGRFDIVSTANNHAWDFGFRCLRETIQNLQRVGIAHVGTDDGGDPLRPVILEKNGQRLAFFAVTGIFNHGSLRNHKAKAYVADADMGALGRRIAKVRPRVDRVIVSVHIGEEYMHVPINATRYAMLGAVDAGADVVLGHHTHTPQRVEFHKGVPVVMSLGNLVFHQHRDHPWTGWGYLARITLPETGPPSVEVCPYHLFDAAPQRLTARQEAAFYQHWDRISISRYAGQRAQRSDDGCTRLLAPVVTAAAAQPTTRAGGRAKSNRGPTTESNSTSTKAEAP